MRAIQPILIVLLFTGFVTIPVKAQTSIQPAESQITAAVSPLPESMKPGAGVLGYNRQGELVSLRERSNELICMADEPGDDRFHVACYHYALEPFMERGRELRADGVTGSEVNEIRRKEIEAGTLQMPPRPMSLYSLTGETDAWDYTTHTLRRARPLYVVYIPFATETTTGLATSPVTRGAPWLMDAGTPWAHIMVGTGREVGELAEGN
ncbi:MAG: hypothetical protein WD355_08100 [Balneolaceae bacterium]